MANLLEITELQVNIGDVSVCKDLSWSVNTREVWGIMGLNGAGKTTLLKTLAGFHKPLSGQITIHGQPLEAYTAQQLAQVGSISETDKLGEPDTP